MAKSLSSRVNGRPPDGTCRAALPISPIHIPPIVGLTNVLGSIVWMLTLIPIAARSCCTICSTALSVAPL